MTARYVVGDQEYTLREEVSPKYVLRVGDNTFVRYEVLRPTNASFTSYSASWVEAVAMSLGFSLYIVFVAFICMQDGRRLD